ncbi:hypothetical protein GCM10010214_10270 [Streptomyces abikoensis]|nr:hypothetical protein GCM10010214_10270 [Streptomyces abikoensis]
MPYSASRDERTGDKRCPSALSATDPPPGSTHDRVTTPTSPAETYRRLREQPDRMA